MSEHELNQMHRYEDKCYEEDGLSSTDKIIEILENTGVLRGVVYEDDFPVAAQEINALSECECCSTCHGKGSHETGAMCGQCQGLGKKKKINSLSEIKEIVYDYNNMTEVTKTEIAKRVIEEWFKTASVLDDGDRNAYFRIISRLDQREAK